METFAKLFAFFASAVVCVTVFGKFARRILQRKVEILLPQHARDLIKTLISRRKATDPNFSVQKMCDEKNLPKSTIDKFLAGQTNDTSWSNVVAMVSYLGGSLDELAGIQRQALKEEAAQDPKPAPASAAPANDLPKAQANHSALDLLSQSHEKEIARLTTQHTDYLDRFRRLIDNDRTALVSQHTAAYTALAEACKETLKQQSAHLDSALRGRNSWRMVTIVLICVLVAVGVYAVWEFSDMYSGITGMLLRRAGLIPNP